MTNRASPRAIRSAPAGDKPEDTGPAEIQQLLAGLAASRKSLPCKFFYDEAGSALFERITRLEEYYPSRTEKSILRRHAAELMHGVAGVSLVEIGSGDCSKISILLQAVPTHLCGGLTYIPFDISPSAVAESRCRLREKFPLVEVEELVADFVRQLDCIARFENKVVCFFGSTIGNLDRNEALGFLARLGRLLKPGERLLLGLDLVKDRAVLERAYNDAEGLTARFNKNILAVVNQILESDFRPEHFRHRAVYDERQQRIEMSLVATRDMTVTSPWFERPLRIAPGESIHTENSHKFTTAHIDDFARAGGFKVRAVHTDSRRWFALVDYVKCSSYSS